MHHVEVLTPAHLPEAAALLSRAFQHDPVIAAILPRVSPETRQEKLAVMFKEILALNARDNDPVGIIQGEAVLAAAILHRPGTFPRPLATELGLLWRVIRKVGSLGLGRFIRWSICTAKHHPPTPHYYLETLGVEPTLQGQGLGSTMLQAIAAQLDASGTECLLETANPKNVVLYERFGFEVVKQEQILGADVRFMRRSPS